MGFRDRELKDKNNDWIISVLYQNEILEEICRNHIISHIHDYYFGSLLKYCRELLLPDWNSSFFALQQGRVIHLEFVLSLR